MLILTRKVGQGILIGADIRVMIIRGRGRSIKLGIEAPPETPVLREELSRNGQTPPKPPARKKPARGT